MTPESLAILSDENWLRTNHVTNLISIGDISKELGVTPASVVRRLRQFNIASPSQQSLREASNMRRHGVANSSQITGSRIKARATNIERFGVPSYSSTEQGKHQRKTTIESRYGSKLEQDILFTQRAKETSLRKYGRAHHKQLSIPIEKLNNLQNKEYMHKLYVESDLSVQQISILIGVSWHSVRTALDAHDMPVRASRLPLAVLAYLDDKDWIDNQLNVERKTLGDLADDLGIDYQVISRRCKQYGIDVSTYVGKYTAAHRKLISDKQWLHSQLFELERDFSDIASTFNTSPHTVKSWYKFHDIDISKYEFKKAAVKTINRLTDRDWLYDQHAIQEKSLLLIATELGMCTTTPTNSGALSAAVKHLGIDVIQHNFSTAEREIGAFLTSLNIEYIANIRSIISPFELDVYVPSHSLAIEYCGVYWHSERKKPDQLCHQRKYLRCKEKGIRLLTIFEDEWIHSQAIIKSKLAHIFKASTDPVVAARKCTVRDLTQIEKNTFFSTNHIQGTGPGSITYGLIHSSEVVAAISFIAKADNEYVLNRYATTCIVPGGFGKLLYAFKHKQPSWQKITTFADLRWSNGELYDKMGFVMDHIIPPDYKYVVGSKTMHKFAFRRDALAKKLDKFDPLVSEWENMKNHGYDRIWDCGKLRFILTNDSVK